MSSSSRTRPPPPFISISPPPPLPFFGISQVAPLNRTPHLLEAARDNFAQLTRCPHEPSKLALSIISASIHAFRPPREIPRDLIRHARSRKPTTHAFVSSVSSYVFSLPPLPLTRPAPPFVSMSRPPQPTTHAFFLILFRLVFFFSSSSGVLPRDPINHA